MTFYNFDNIDKKKLQLTRALQQWANLQSSTVFIRLNFSSKLKISASITRPSQSPKTLERYADFYNTYHHLSGQIKKIKLYGKDYQ